MTERFGSVILCWKIEGPLVRKGTRASRSRALTHRARDGKAMLQIHTQNMKIEYRPYDLQGTIMPSAEKAERFNDACLLKAGSSGCLYPNVRRYILE